jgi:hypothetical protein
MPVEKPKTARFLFLTALLLIAATLIFLVILVPLTVISIGPNISILTLGMLVIITTVASLITLLFYIMLTKR